MSKYWADGRVVGIEWRWTLDFDELNDMLPEGIPAEKVSEGLAEIAKRWDNWLNEQASDIVRDVVDEIEQKAIKKEEKK